MAPHLRNATFLLWIFFLVWSALAFIVLPLNIGSAGVRERLGDPAISGLARTAEFLLAQFDFIWFFLAALSTYFALILSEGLRFARRSTGLVLVAVTLLLFLANGSTVAGSAPLFFSGKLGYRLAGRVPLGAPLLGMTLFFSARGLLLFLSSRRREWQPRTPLLFSATLGLLNGLALWNVATVAFHHRFYAIWLENSYAAGMAAFAWGIAAFLLALLIRGEHGGTTGGANVRPTIIFCLINAVFLLENLVR